MNSVICIIVGYNEEQNLAKLFDSLHNHRNTLFKRVVYIDQSSFDASLSIAEQYGAEVYLHPNAGYADNDKKWAIDTLCEENDWVLFLDADESICDIEVIANAINNQKYSAYLIPIDTKFLGIINGVFLQPRLLKKGGAVVVTEHIHEIFAILNTAQLGKLTRCIDNHDLKSVGREIEILIQKQLRYATIEQKKFSDDFPLWKIRLNLFWMPILWFFGWGIHHKLFFKGIPGIIFCTIMAWYQFLIYSLLYEKKRK